MCRVVKRSGAECSVVVVVAVAVVGVVAIVEWSGV